MAASKLVVPENWYGGIKKCTEGLENYHLNIPFIIEKKEYQPNMPPFEGNSDQAYFGMFGNLGARYRMKNVDWMLDWTNIFNTRQFVTYSYNDISSYSSVYRLRPAEALLKVRFKIF
ncbi:hypothetical protein [Proteiniphilum sp.]|uniref:hypothetical protein n=1 Tax=Proteiniphilum sp. TaxID=1926877 RepID=UPI00332364C1